MYKSQAMIGRSGAWNHLWDIHVLISTSSLICRQLSELSWPDSPEISCWPCCCCLSYCPWPSPLSPNSMTPPHHHHHPTRWIWDLWLVETGWLCRHSPSAHSSVDLGVVLRISFAAGPISPFTNSPRRKKLKEFALLLHLWNILRVLTRPFAVISVSGLLLGFGWRRRCRHSTWIFGRKLAVFVQSFDRLGPFVAPEAWEHKSPRPVEKRKPRWKNRRKAQLLPRRQTDR